MRQAFAPTCAFVKIHVAALALRNCHVRELCVLVWISKHFLPKVRYLACNISILSSILFSRTFHCAYSDISHASDSRRLVHVFGPSLDILHRIFLQNRFTDSSPPSPLRQMCMRCSGSISLELFFRDSSRQFELVEEAVLVLVTQFCLQLQVLGSRQLRNPRGSVAALAVLQAAITSHAKADSCFDPSLQTRVRECTSHLYEQPVLIPSLL